MQVTFGSTARARGGSWWRRQQVVHDAGPDDDVQRHLRGRPPGARTQRQIGDAAGGEAAERRRGRPTGPEAERLMPRSRAARPAAGASASARFRRSASCSSPAATSTPGSSTLGSGAKVGRSLGATCACAICFPQSDAPGRRQARQQGLGGLRSGVAGGHFPDPRCASRGRCPRPATRDRQLCTIRVQPLQALVILLAATARFVSDRVACRSSASASGSRRRSAKASSNCAGARGRPALHSGRRDFPGAGRNAEAEVALLPGAIFRTQSTLLAKCS